MSLTKNSNLIPTVCNIYFAPLDDIDTITPVTDRFHRQITFKEALSWQEIYFTPGTAEFTEKPKENDAGELIEQLLKFSLPGEDDSNLADLDGILGRPVLVKIEYSSGGKKLLGDLGNGAKLSQLLQISVKQTGSQLEFSCMATYRACWITD